MKKILFALILSGFVTNLAFALPPQRPITNIPAKPAVEKSSEQNKEQQKNSDADKDANSNAHEAIPETD